jgi:hypothetical protein
MAVGQNDVDDLDRLFIDDVDHAFIKSARVDNKSFISILIVHKIRIDCQRTAGEATDLHGISFLPEYRTRYARER